MKKKVWWSFSVALALLALIGVAAYTEVIKLPANDAMAHMQEAALTARL